MSERGPGTGAWRPRLVSIAISLLVLLPFLPTASAAFFYRVLVTRERSFGIG